MEENNKIIEIVVEPEKIYKNTSFKLKIKTIRYVICKEAKIKTCKEMKKITCKEVDGK